jgi:hypothetical protein
VYGGIVSRVGVLATEAGTFFVAGQVTDADTGVGIRATIDTVDFAGVPIKAESEPHEYLLLGLQGAVRLEFSAPHYERRTIDLVVSRDFPDTVVSLKPTSAVINLSGRWTMTIGAPPGCAVPSRTYSALIDHAGSVFSADLTGATVLNGFTEGRVFGDTVDFRFAKHFFDVDDVGYNVLERLQPQGVLGIQGNVSGEGDEHQDRWCLRGQL